MPVTALRMFIGSRAVRKRSRCTRLWAGRPGGSSPPAVRLSLTRSRRTRTGSRAERLAERHISRSRRKRLMPVAWNDGPEPDGDGTDVSPLRKGGTLSPSPSGSGREATTDTPRGIGNPHHGESNPATIRTMTTQPVSRLPSVCAECGAVYVREQHGSKCQSCSEPDRREREQRRGSRQERGYGARWDRLSARARRLQPFCSDCGATTDLTTDHSEEAWRRHERGQSIRLRDVDVVCRSCNGKRGRARPSELGSTAGTTPDNKRTGVQLDAIREQLDGRECLLMFGPDLRPRRRDIPRKGRGGTGAD